jgi:hypothetical protein
MAVIHFSPIAQAPNSEFHMPCSLFTIRAVSDVVIIMSFGSEFRISLIG